MSNRMVRVNSLVMREISHIIHTEFQLESVAITITEVDIEPDLRAGKVYYSVFGDDNQIQEAKKFFKRYSGRIKFLMGNAIVLKYTPHLTYIYDDSLAKGADLLTYMEGVEQEDEIPSKEDPENG